MELDDYLLGVRERTLSRSDLTCLLQTINETYGAGSVEALSLRLGPHPPEETAPAIRIRQVGAFLSQVGQPPPMLIQELLPEKSLFLLSGKPKHLKSFIALDLADSVARKNNAFGMYAVNRSGPVVYLAMEDGEYEVANRCLARGIRPGDERTLYLSTERFTLATQDATNALRRLIEPIAPVLLIIDTATEALGIRKWEDRGEVTDKMRPLRDFAREVCSVLLVAHNRKAEGDGGDEIAGTNGFTGAVDGWISVYSKSVLGNGNVQLLCRKEGRGGVRGEFALEMNTHTLHMTGLSAGEMNEARKRDAEREAQARRKRLFAQIGKAVSGPFSNRAGVGDIARLLELPYRECTGAVREMVELGYLQDTGEQRKAAGPGRPTPLYAVTELFISGDFPNHNSEKINNSPSPTPDETFPVKTFFNPPPPPPHDPDDNEEDWTTP